MYKLPMKSFGVVNAWVIRILLGMCCLVGMVHAAQNSPATAAAAGQNKNKSEVLAANIAKLAAGGHLDPKVSLRTSYEAVYGNIDKVPDTWPALVRRVLVCQQIENYDCTHSSIQAISDLGGIDKLPLTHLFEVTRFGMTTATIHERLEHASQKMIIRETSQTPQVKQNVASASAAASTTASAPHAAVLPPIPAVTPKPATPVAPVSVTPAQNKVQASTSEVKVAPSVPTPASVPAPVATTHTVVASTPASASTGASSATPAKTQAAADPKAHTAVVPPKKVEAASAKPAANPVKASATPNLPQKASNHSEKVEADQSVYFLDVLFVFGAIALLLAYFLFVVSRSRNDERLAKEAVIQEMQRIENQRAEEKVQAEHDLLSEKLKAELALETEKTQAEEIAKKEKLQAEELLQARLQAQLQTELALFDEVLKAEQAKAELAVDAERKRSADLIKMEQQRSEIEIKGAKLRAEQAIDAYDQMAARELVLAHQEADGLQAELDGEKKIRELLEKKLNDAAANYKQNEERLLEEIQNEQRLRVVDARIATEKLKAAQQAAAALQASLVATRALKADMEKRADDALKAAEARLAEALQRNNATITQEG